MDKTAEIAPETELLTEEEFTAEETAPLLDELSELAEEFPELGSISDITELREGERYKELRSLGLSAREAYLATSPKVSRPDTRAHLSDSFPRSARSPRSGMTRAELREAREIFAGLGDAQIMELYKKVTE